MKITHKISILILSIVIIGLLVVEIAIAQSGTQRFARIITRQLVVTNAATFQSAATLNGGLDLNGQELTLDADADTSITADTDDQVDLEIAGTDEFTFTATAIDVGGNEITLDVDNDTSITADTDDQVDFEIAGADEFTFTATAIDVGGNEITLDVDNDTSITADTDDQVDFEIAGADELVLTAASFDFNDTLIDQDINTENLMLPTVASQAFTYTAAAGGTVSLFTVTDGEIWLIHSVLVNVTTNFDCTADDCTLVIGDGNDPNGFCDFVDAELQTTDTEITGAPAGWQCFSSADVIGAYFTSGRGFVYAPSGADETIDAVLAATGDDFSAGAATVYIVYTRIQ